MLPRVRLLLLVVAAVLGAAPPAAAQPAQFVFRGREGNLRQARIADLSDLTSRCDVEAPRDARPSVQVRLVSAEGRQLLTAYVRPTAPRVAFLAGPGTILPEGVWCLSTDELTRALLSAQRLPDSQGPWLGFVLAVGGLGLAILLIAVFGGGVGPRPTLAQTEPAPEEDEGAEGGPDEDGA